MTQWDTNIHVVADIPCHTGENPLWHPDEGCLYWVDIPAGHLYRYDPENRSTARFEVGKAVGGFTLHEDGRLLLFMANGTVALWSHDSLETVIPSLPDEQDNRFNDVIADPEGRVFCGVMSTPHRAGRLYRLDPDGTLSVMLEDTGTANGMGFSTDLTQMYFCDSGQRTISVFRYDRATGALSDRRVLVHPEPREGKPDGMTVDTNGHLWSARWDGAQLVQHAPNGDVLRVIQFPVKKVSCVTFGGPTYTDMYVTTAGGTDRPENGHHAGALFHLNLGIQGRPEFRSRRIQASAGRVGPS